MSRLHRGLRCYLLPFLDSGLVSTECAAARISSVPKVLCCSTKLMHQARTKNASNSAVQSRQEIGHGSCVKTSVFFKIKAPPCRFALLYLVFLIMDDQTFILEVENHTILQFCWDFADPNRQAALAGAPHLTRSR